VITLTVIYNFIFEYKTQVIFNLIYFFCLTSGPPEQNIYIFVFLIIQNLKVVAMGVVAAIAFFWPNRPNPAIKRGPGWVKPLGNHKPLVWAG
jgi:hypothetical protein